MIRLIVFTSLFFSLNTLSMTCTTLRHACSAFLQFKGCVSIHWESSLSKNEEGRRWKCESKVNIYLPGLIKYI